MKVTPVARKQTVTFKTKDVKESLVITPWWKGKTSPERASQVLATAAFLKESQNYRSRQASIYARLYGNLSLFNFIGSNSSKMDQGSGLPTDRPTFNIVQSCVDTLVSRISQSRPSPVFLTDNSDYKERKLSKQLNNFISGELYQTEAYHKGEYILRDALVEGTGILHVYETQDHKVGLERVLLTELYTDPNESIYGEPRQLYRLKLVDRAVLIENFPEFAKNIEVAENAYPDNSADSAKTVSDLILVVETWHLRSGEDAKDGRHMIVCSAGTIVDEEWNKDKFPFVFLHFSKRLLGFWSQGLAEQLMGTQMEINSLLFTISRAIKLVGVPRIFVEDGSKVVKSHFNNEIGSIITFRGTKPTYEVAQCVPQELYAQLQRLIDYGYQQSGVSALNASSEKPAGLNSGEAIRSYEDITNDRFAALDRRYANVFIDLAYQITDLAMDIAKREGKYQTVYPNKNGAKQIDLPKMSLLKDPFVIQCFNSSALPKDPAGRRQTVSEMITSGMITIKEGRRLLDFPDIEQVNILANASEERIFKILDEIVEEGKYTAPDPFMDIALATELTVQYINLYVACKLEEEKAEQLRTFYTQLGDLKQQAAAALAPPPAMPGSPPTPGAPQVPAPTVAPPPELQGITSAVT